MTYRLYVLWLTIMFAPLELCGDSLDVVLSELDRVIENHERYDGIRLARIEILREKAQTLPPLSAEMYDINRLLYNEYNPWICDSAIVYLDRNLAIATALDDNDRVYESALMLSKLLASSGMYKEASDVLNLVSRKHIPLHLMVLYYETCDNLYGELAFGTQYMSTQSRYRTLSNLYRDSLEALLPKSSTKYLILHENRLRDYGEIERSLEMNDIRLTQYPFPGPEFALATFHRALSCREMGDTHNYKLNLALSAIGDISSAINDHASLWMLAQQLYAEGEFEKAHDYMRFSWNRTITHNARLRNVQSSSLLSMIDATYQSTMKRRNNAMTIFTIVVSVLSVLLISALLFIYRHLHRISAVQKDLSEANRCLVKLNDELGCSNSALMESNSIKEEYLGRFIELCSMYVWRLDSYRRMVNKKISSGQTRELFEVTRSPEMIDTTLRELYTNFDTAFLNLFPDFVERFNELLTDPILPKKGELLNTELRIFALIRLGIGDSGQIAEFLRYSVNTIYNYRAKVKNKAKTFRDDFESMVKLIR